MQPGGSPAHEPTPTRVYPLELAQASHWLWFRCTPAAQSVPVYEPTANGDKQVSHVHLGHCSGSPVLSKVTANCARRLRPPCIPWLSSSGCGCTSLTFSAPACKCMCLSRPLRATYHTPRGRNYRYRGGHQPAAYIQWLASHIRLCWKVKDCADCTVSQGLHRRVSSHLAGGPGIERAYAVAGKSRLVAELRERTYPSAGTRSPSASPSPPQCDPQRWPDHTNAWPSRNYHAAHEGRNSIQAAVRRLQGFQACS